MRKYTIFIFLLLFAIVSYSQVDSTKWNQTDKKGNKQGKWRKYYENGKLKYTGEFKDDQPTGTFTYYFIKGKKKAVMKYLKPGYCMVDMYYESGSLHATGYYKNKVKDSLWIYFSPRKTKLSREYYKDGKKEGKWYVFYDSGPVYEITHYKNDIKHGKFIQYFLNGKVKVEYNYQNGLIVGEYISNYPNGRIRIKGRYINSMKTGAWMFYDDTGRLNKVEIYENNKLIKTVEHQPPKDKLE
jgi:antitoxin component YwqK of YwqJK toxin-antitoxin module